MSSTTGDSPEIQSAPTTDPPSPYLPPRMKRQRIYQSISSAFSKKTSTRANLPEPTSPSPAIAANLPEVFQSPSNLSPTPDEEDNYSVLEVSEVFRPMDNDSKVGDSPRQEPEIDEPGTAPAQLQSDAKGSSTGEFAFAPTIEEVTSALEDLK